MAQHDYVIANGTGAAVRSDLNNALAAIVSQNSGATAPATTYAFQFWADTTTGLLKLRNSANNAWVTLFQLDGEWSTLPVENGTAAAPSIYFKDSGTDTGFYSPGTDQVAISTGGTGRLFINSSGSVGIGTSSPNANVRLEVSGNISSNGDASPGGAGITIGDNQSGGYKWIQSFESHPLVLNPLGNNVGIGTQSPQGKLIVSNGGANGIEFFPDTDSGVNSTINSYNRSSSAFSALTINAAQHIFLTASSEAARIDSSKRLLVGTSSARTNFFGNGGFVPAIQVDSAGSPGNQYISIIGNSASSGYAGGLVLAKTRGATVGSITAVQNNDELGILSFQGTDGTNPIPAAAIQAYVDATPGTNDMPGRLVFSTTADGASSPTERMRIIQQGHVKISNSGSYQQSNADYHEILQTANNTLLYCSQTYNFGASTGNYGQVIHFTGHSPDNNNSTFFACKDTTANRMLVYSDGDVWTSDAGTLTSDITLKRDITDASPKLADVMKLRVRNFYWEENYHPNKQDKKLIGFIAQEFEEVFPGLVSDHRIKGGEPVFDEDGNDTGKKTPEVFKKGIKEAKLVPILVKALQEAVERIEQLEAKVSVLESKP